MFTWVKNLLYLIFLWLSGSNLIYAQVYVVNEGGRLIIDTSTIMIISGNLTNQNNGIINNDGTIRLSGDFSNTAEFDQDTGLVLLNGSSPQSLSGDSSTYYFLEIDNVSGATVVSGVHQIKNSLTLTSGAFFTNDSVVLLSDEDLTARIPEIQSGALISGYIIMQRYLDNGVTGWHLIGTATSGGTLKEWDDDFTTSGFTGSQFPGFNFNNIHTYLESDTSIKDTGYHGATNITNAISTGVGYWSYIGPVPLTLDSKGPAHTFGQSLPVTYTNNKDLIHDGWNMVANPYPSNINWNSGGWTKINIDNAIYIYDPDNGVYASYVSGVGTNGGTQYIASSQGFWVKANAPSPILTLTEPVKTSVSATFFKQKVSLASSPLIRLKVRPEAGGLSDETVLGFSPLASGGWDSEFDAYKLEDNYSPAPYIATVLGNKDLSVDALPEVANEGSIPLRVKVVTSGQYKIEITRKGNSDPGNCLFLEDLENGKITDLKTDSFYRFFILDTVTSARFIIHTNPKVELGPDTFVKKGKSITLNAGMGYKDYLWSNGATTQLISVDEPGTYSVEVINVFGCIGYDEIEVGLDSVTGLPDKEVDKYNLFSIYPNPAKDYFELTASGLEPGDYTIHLYNDLGHEIMGKTIYLDHQQISYKISAISLSSGIYLFVLKGPSGVFTEKLVVLKN